MESLREYHVIAEQFVLIRSHDFSRIAITYKTASQSALFETELVHLFSWKSAKVGLPSNTHSLQGFKKRNACVSTVRGEGLTSRSSLIIILYSVCVCVCVCVCVVCILGAGTSSVPV